MFSWALFTSSGKQQQQQQGVQQQSSTREKQQQGAQSAGREREQLQLQRTQPRPSNSSSIRKSAVVADEKTTISSEIRLLIEGSSSSSDEFGSAPIGDDELDEDFSFVSCSAGSSNEELFQSEKRDGSSSSSNSSNNILYDPDWVWVCSKKEPEPVPAAARHNYAWYPFSDADDGKHDDCDAQQQIGGCSTAAVATASLSSATTNSNNRRSSPTNSNGSGGVADNNNINSSMLTSCRNDWQITPPSCFTRQDVPEIERQMYNSEHYNYNSSEYRKDPPRPLPTEISVIENLLIEHPSMSIFEQFPERFANIRSETLSYKNNRAKRNSQNDNSSNQIQNSAPSNPDIFKCTENTTTSLNHHRRHPSNHHQSGYNRPTVAPPPKYSDISAQQMSSLAATCFLDENDLSALGTPPPYYDSLLLENGNCCSISQRSLTNSGKNGDFCNCCPANAPPTNKKKNYHRAANPMANLSNSEICRRSGLKNTYKKLV